jgi:hypothetical protein
MWCLSEDRGPIQLGAMPDCSLATRVGGGKAGDEAFACLHAYESEMLPYGFATLRATTTGGT